MLSRWLMTVGVVHTQLGTFCEGTQIFPTCVPRLMGWTGPRSVGTRTLGWSWNKLIAVLAPGGQIAAAVANMSGQKGWKS